MGAYLVKAAVLGDRAILADVEVIAHVEEATGEMVVLELLGGVVLGLAGGGTVNYYIADGVSRHLNAFFDI